MYIPTCTTRIVVLIVSSRQLSSELKRPFICGSFHTLSVSWTVTFPCLRDRESQTVSDLIRVGLDLCVNQAMHGQSESHNGTPQPPSAHATMLARLVRLILIVTVSSKLPNVVLLLLQLEWAQHSKNGHAAPGDKQGYASRLIN